MAVVNVLAALHAERKKPLTREEKIKKDAETATKFDRSIGRPLYKVHKRIYQLSDGRLMTTLEGRPLLVFSCLGAKSGIWRDVPIQYKPHGEEIIMVASNGGRPEHPAWLANVRKNPLVKVHAERRHFEAVARIADAEERAQLWPMLVDWYPTYAHYQSLTDREIQVVVLTPVGT